MKVEYSVFVSDELNDNDSSFTTNFKTIFCASNVRNLSVISNPTLNEAEINYKCSETVVTQILMFGICRW